MVQEKCDVTTALTRIIRLSRPPRQMFPLQQMSRALTQRARLWVRGALELLERVILLDAACNDDGRGDTELLAGKVDPLGLLRASELVDLKRVAIDTVPGRTHKSSKCEG